MSSTLEKTINITLPVKNGAPWLADSVRILCDYLGSLASSSKYEIVIANNGSTDDTGDISHRLCSEYAQVTQRTLPVAGRGRALRDAWLTSDADILSYMDIDLSTDLSAFPRLIAPLQEQSADISVGSRTLEDSRTVRCFKRELLSRGYNALLRCCFSNRFTDAQCGFKAISQKAAKQLLPTIVDDEWFFDTELLLRAETIGMRIAEIPITWRENRASTVALAGTIIKKLNGIHRMRSWSARQHAHALVSKSVDAGID